MRLGVKNADSQPLSKSPTSKPPGTVVERRHTMNFFLGIDPDASSTAMALIADCEKGPGPLIGVWKITLEDGDGVDSLGMCMAIARTFVAGVLPNEDETYKVLAVAVEGQEIVYTGKSGRNPRDVALLGPISGGAIVAGKILWPSARFFFPKPAQWKGQKPKAKHQALTYTSMGWKYENRGSGSGKYAVPLDVPSSVVGIEDINPGDWKHIGDALGLAQWGKEEYHKWADKQRVVSAKLASMKEEAAAVAASANGKDAATAAKAAE